MLAPPINSEQEDEFNIKRDSERIFILILNIRGRIGTIFLHENDRKKIRIRQVIRTHEAIQTRLDTIDTLISSYREKSGKIKKLIEGILESMEISEGEIIDEIHQKNIRIRAEEIARLQPGTNEREVEIVKHLLYAAGISKEGVDRYVRGTVERNIAKKSIK